MKTSSTVQNSGIGNSSVISQLCQTAGASLFYLLAFMASIFLILSVLVVLENGQQAFADDPEDIHTSEFYSNTESKYWGQGGNLGSIHADDAYALDYTGAGVLVGVVDTFGLLGHTEFANKENKSRRFPSGYSPSDFNHGIQVTGIIAANKDDVRMHGVAYDAGFVNLIRSDLGFTFGWLRSLKEIFIVNNSWGYAEINLADQGVLKNNDLLDDYNLYEKIINYSLFGYSIISCLNEINYLRNGIDSLSQGRDVLLVFAAGNEGRTSPLAPATFPSLIKGTTLWNGNKIEPFGSVLENDRVTWENIGLDLGQEDDIALFGENWKNNIITVSSFNHRYQSNSILF
jgi:subtilisin family serine protease